MAASDATFVPVKNQAYRVTFPILDADGDLVTGATTPDSEVSKDGGTYADCTNEATEIATASGMYFLDLTATEMNADTVAIIVKSGNGKTVPIVLYPQQAGSELKVDVTHWNSTAVATPDTAGHPKVTVKSGAGTGEISLTSGQVAISTSSENSIAGKVWDEPTSTHVASGSFGAAHNPTDHGTAQAGGGSTITLRSGAVNDDDYYNNQLLKIVAGTGVGQSEYILDYVGATRVATMATAWDVNPDSSSVYVISGGGTIPGASAPTAADNANAVWDKAMSAHLTSGSFGQMLNFLRLRTGTAQAGSLNSITLDAGADATDDRYNLNYIVILSGTGYGQTRQITDYAGGTKVATVNLAWVVNPSSDSVFAILPGGLDAATVASIAAGVWAATRSGNSQAGSFGEYVFADAIRLSGDPTAADNSEAFFDGTGYAGTNNVIPNVTTVTGNVNGSVASVTGNVGGSVATVTALAANAVNASALAADAVTEIQSGLALAADLTTVDTVVDAIKAKTDSLTFTQAGHVDANVQRINDVLLIGNGSTTPWGP